MLLGLGSVTVAPGPDGTTIETDEEGHQTILFPEITVTATAPKPKPAVKKPAPATSVSAVLSRFVGDLDVKVFGIRKKVILVTGLLAVVGWLLTGGLAGKGRRRGGILRGLFARNPRKRRRARRVGRALYARNPRYLRAEYEDPHVRRAVDFRREFHWGYPAQRISRRRVSPPPDVLVQLGTLKSVVYQTKKKGERAKYFVHDFEKQKPTLAMDIRNKRLHFVGGSYTVTADGITG